MGYTKLDENLVTSSIWSEDDKTLRVWCYLMARADSNGWVLDTIPAIARACNYDLSTVEAILGKFAGPDKYSRTKDHDGRRIAILNEPEFGIYLLNHLKYREKDHTAAERQRRHRASKAAVTVTDVTRDERDVTPKTVTVTQAEAEATTKTEPKTETERPVGRSAPKNPLMGRAREESECLRLVEAIRDHPRLAGAKLWPTQDHDADGSQIVMAASEFKGRGVPNPAEMTDGRLAHTNATLRKWLAALEARAAPPPVRETVFQRAEREFREDEEKRRRASA